MRELNLNEHVFTEQGRFTIDTASFFRNRSGALKVGSFSASFEQHSEGAAPALFGSLANTNRSAPVPEPGTIALLGAGSAGFLLRRRRR